MALGGMKFPSSQWGFDSPHPLHTYHELRKRGSHHCDTASMALDIT